MQSIIGGDTPRVKCKVTEVAYVNDEVIILLECNEAFICMHN